MKVLFISNDSKQIGRLELLVSKVASSITMMHYDAISPDRAKDADLIILSGGSGLAVTKNLEKFEDEFELVRNARIPLIGICLGFEIIVTAFGGELQYREEEVNSLEKITVIKDHPMFADRKVFTGKEAHWYYIESLPDTLEPLAGSIHGIEVFAHKERPIYGFQFHPENQLVPNDGEEIFKNLIEYIYGTHYLPRQAN